MFGVFLFSEYLFEKALSVGAAAVLTLLAEGCLKALKNLLLLCVEVAGSLYVYSDNEVAETLGVVNVSDTLTFDSSARSGFCG